METFLAVAAAVINALCVALFQNPQSKILNGIAAGLSLLIALMCQLRRRREHKRGAAV
jgi:hypothetical protein